MNSAINCGYSAPALTADMCLTNGGILNAPEARLTTTPVTMHPGAKTPRHLHPASEQTWVVGQGTATLLLANGETAPVKVGDVIRTTAGETHGLRNTGGEPFVYLTATTPPIDLTA